MAQLRASRKKKPIVVSSDSDQDEDHSPPPKRAKRGSTLLTASTTGTRKDAKPTTARTRRISPSSPSSTSSKRAATKSPAKPKPSFKPITSFFGKAPLRPQSNHPTPSPEKSGASTPLVDVDDIIDSEDDDAPLQPVKRQTSLPLRKGKGVVTASADNVSKNSQKFRRTQPAGPAPAVDRRPWNERFGPTSLNELAVHKKKVETVREWLTGVLGGKERKRLLLLKGPAGSGKTTTLSLLSKEMGVHIHEWKNPTSSLPSSEGFVSATAQFEEFVGRTGAFGSLTFEGNAQSHQQIPSPAQSGRQKQLVLVEEFPNTFTRGSSIIQSFRSSVLNYLAAATPSASSFFSGKANVDQPVTPVVMIISETLLSTNTASADSFTAHRLLGPEILTHPGVTVVEFNPIAPTFMTKALDLVILKEARKSGRKKTVGPQVIQHLTELGDIRSAISSLEFLCLRGDEGDWSANVQPSKAKKQKDVPMTKMEQDSLIMVTQRESTLGIFHAVGRVVYNKRLPGDASGPVPQPPTYFPDRRRPKAPEANADTLINELGTDTDTFVAALHENYVLSTDAGDNEETLDCINGCIDALSDADLLSPDRFGRSGRNIQGSGADNLRQDEMSFQTSVRGLLYSLPNPVKRVAPPPGVMGTRAKGVNGAGNSGNSGGASKGSAFAMYYPASLRLWRQQEETSGLLEMWISRAQRGDLLVPSATTTTSTPSVAGGVDTWRKTTTPFSKPPPNPTTTSSSSSSSPSNAPDTPSPVLLGSGTSARTEMLLERLPYVARILSQHSKPRPHPHRLHQPPSPAITAALRDIKKITAFHGSTSTHLGAGDEDDENDGDDVAAVLSDAEQWTTDRPGYATPRKGKKRGVWMKKNAGEDVGVESAVPGIAMEDKGGVLSDDDIED
ncbi:Rad17-domain-containing protein [Periconia macrospinosa]|uniref:Rad17-domain-containing protein n=1 Tax=Periconia macrospinosa TaxID=97972 RepID=A0A2V1DJ99_9PLEO|nr:Rad17-domain-containing protein [Periconia macrospinosa]